MIFEKYIATHMKRIPTIKETAQFLSNCDTPLGDLCREMLNDKYFPFYDIKAAWAYLNELIIDDYYADSIRRFKTIYNSIKNS